MRHPTNATVVFFALLNTLIIRWTLTAEALDSRFVSLNGKLLTVVDEELPAMAPVSVPTGGATLAVGPRSIVFAVLESFTPPACSPPV